jgi:hypothetical protein
VAQFTFFLDADLYGFGASEPAARSNPDAS